MAEFGFTTLLTARNPSPPPSPNSPLARNLPASLPPLPVSTRAALLPGPS
uniref:Uncharacterized protein n=1 Tax=Arundo donax TaxID=35708 RepID=A0A0A9G9A4_ARUDO